MTVKRKNCIIAIENKNKVKLALDEHSWVKCVSFVFSINLQIN